MTAAAAVYPPALCTAILRGIAAQHSREGRCLPAPLQRKLNQGRGVFDLQKDSRVGELDLQKLVLEAAEEANLNTDLEMGDAPIIDETDFGAFVGSGSEGLSWSESSGGHGPGGGSQSYWDDIAGAALPPELVSAARSEEIRFVESRGVWEVRPISECLSR